MNRYDHKKIQKKWQKKWAGDNPYKSMKKDGREKFYILDMFPYPSALGLHMGHTEGYSATDILARYKTMAGFDVLHPQGFDAFGLPAENYAIKTGIHPAKSTKENIDSILKQMKSLGLCHDFSGNVITSSPQYYKWTQYFFGKFFENGLAYKKRDKINWCDSCKTALANEQVENGKCERCKNEVVKKEVPGWFFKTTYFADDLIKDLDKVDWPTHTKVNQINWIGKSEGSEIDFQIKDSSEKFTVFTTRADTLYGVTYCVLAPEHNLIEDLKDKIENYDEVHKYVHRAKNTSERDRLESKEKTGVELKGIKVINPANGEEVPLWVADYVLGSYGTGAVMAVPAHDERDFEFAEKKHLKIKTVVSDRKVFYSEKEYGEYSELKEKKKSSVIFTGYGILINSQEFDGMGSEEAKIKITEKVSGRLVSNYRLRDWSVSRQRYWGAPIPIVYSPEGEAKFVGAENLPWTLPEDVDFIPTGEAPLKKSKELFERTERIFGKGWVPETDTLDTFVCSSWYYLRYPDPDNENEFCSKENLKRWLPVDIYIGGAEHTYMHLLFARFFTKALKEIGLVDFDEPFLKLRHQGMVLDKEGVKMSKSKGNVVNPDEMIDKYGADAVRLYMMFVAPLEDDKMWNEDNIVGVYRFLERVWKFAFMRTDFEDWLKNDSNSSLDLKKSLSKTIKKVGEDIEKMQFNTAISSMMIFLNEIYKSYPSKLMSNTKTKGGEYKDFLNINDFKDFLKILAPFAPHITQEMWSRFGEKGSIHTQNWPKYDEELAEEMEIKVVIQINGKVRASIDTKKGVLQKDLEKKALGMPEIIKWIEGGEIKKVIYVKDKILNIVI